MGDNRWLQRLATALFIVLGTIECAAQPAPRLPAGARPGPEVPDDMRRPADEPLNNSDNVDNPLLQTLAEGRKTLLSVLTPATAARLGFDGVPAQADIKIVTGLRESMIQVQDVRDYSGGDPRPLLRSGGRVIFPVVVGNQVRSAVTVARIRKQWKVVSIGSAGLIRAVFSTVLAARKQLPQSGAGVQWGVTHINGLNQYFVVAELGSRLLLVPMVRNAALKLEPGVPRDADAVLKALQPAARAFRGGAPT